MEYYLKEIREKTIEKMTERHAGGKARADVSGILDKMDIQKLEFRVWENRREQSGCFKRMAWHFLTFFRLRNALKNVKKGDVLYIQFPILDHSIFQGFYFKFIKRNIKIVLIIHDLLLFREGRITKNLLQKIRLWIEEMTVLKCSSAIVVHNDKMASVLMEMGIESSKLIALQIFDYLRASADMGHESKASACSAGEIIIAGNLNRHKAGYVYNLPLTLTYNLYGVGYDGVQNEYIHYCGSYDAEELTFVLEGKFGLVWDGPSVENCTGAYGEYLRINNPHKTSLYLASGIPVVIWNQAALAQFVRQNQCGILIDSLRNLRIRLDEMSEKEYRDLRKNAEHIGEKISTGFYLQRAIIESRKLTVR